MSVETLGYPDEANRSPIMHRVVKVVLGATGLDSYVELDDGSRLEVESVGVRSSRDMVRSIDLDINGANVEIAGKRWNDQ